MTLLILSIIVIFTSIFHSWPFAESRLWQQLSPPNVCVIIGSLLIVSKIYKNYTLLKNHIPHVSIISFLLVNFLSLIITPDIERSVVVIIKLILILFWAYVLLSYSIADLKKIVLLSYVTVISVAILVSYCLVRRYGYEDSGCGFFNSPYKYSSYIGTLLPFCSVFLLLSRKTILIVLGSLLVIAGVLSCASVGGFLAILLSMSLILFLLPLWRIKILIIMLFICILASMYFGHGHKAIQQLKDDAKITESNEPHIKQRYIEWQAELNMLEDKTILGSGTGCINEYRSKYYYRLPKLNTLNEYDYNGWLLVAGECGVLGLVCFMWIFQYNFYSLWKKLSSVHKRSIDTEQRILYACFAGTVGAVVSHMFSSLLYNGVSIAFIVILVISNRTIMYSEE